MTIKNVSLVNIGVILIIIVTRWIFELHQFEFDTITITLLFVCIGISFIPYASDVNIFSVFKITRLDNEIKEVKINFYKGKIVNVVEDNMELYIDKDGIYHEIPDNKTKDFLLSQEGIIHIRKKELKFFRKGNKLESVLDSRCVFWQEAGGHYFIIMNNKKYHVPTASFFADWGWENIELERISTENIQKIETGK